MKRLFIYTKKVRLTLFLVIFSLTVPLFGGMNENISLEYTEKAKKSFDEGNLEKAIFYIKKAGEFSRTYSDYWCIAGLVARLDNNLDKAIRLQRKGLELDLWINLSRYDGLIALSNDLFRTKRYKEQIKLYEETFPIYSLGEEFYLLTVQSLYFDGFYDKAREWAEKGIILFPHRIEFLFILKKIDDDPMISDRIFYKADYYKINIEEEIRVYLSEKNPDDYQKWITFYKEHYGETSFYSLLTKEADNTTFAAVYGDLRFLKKQRDKKQLPNTGNTLIRDGDFYIDANYDGYNEELIKIGNGKLIQWFIDKDQNGKSEFIVDFGDDGLPSKIVNENLIVEYAPYPYVKTATIEGENNYRRVYRYIHKTFKLDLLLNFKKSGLEGNYKGDFLWLKPITVEESLLFKNAGILEKRVDNIVLDRYTIVKGVTVVIVIDNDANGIFDEEIVLNKEGFIRSGRRDINEDGEYDLYDHYARGVWEGFSYDSDGDNVPEFYRDWSLIDTKIWDEDGDGYIDSKYIKDGKGRKITEGFLYRDKLTKIDFLSWDFRYSRHWFR